MSAGSLSLEIRKLQSQLEGLDGGGLTSEIAKLQEQVERVTSRVKSVVERVDAAPEVSPAAAEPGAAT
eukprot:CAMPEP_0183811102 /NCGR_PEP_ID=MMETSP0803_2-20130417/48732_1 /TAXON_ID=195967 /ORGANISM="Crustomastix stigmata, Strain CCMP3273" /LENGTH=67 /DNA_ID=CAMNT_0026055929 /DNA_START=9 /DNA_END=209 /DNA_ORIENTATION=+